MLNRAITEAALPPGTRRQWKSGWHIKLKSGKWVRDTPEARRQAGGSDVGSTEVKKKREYQAKLKSTISEFKDAVASGKIGEPGMSFKDHVRVAKATMKKHNARKDALLGELRGMAGEKAQVMGRVKVMESVLGKMLRKPKYKKADQLQDITGTRVIHDSIDEVKSTVAKLKKRFKVVDEDNYIDTPQGDYRSHHLIIEDDDGQQKEVQVRTRNQDVFANWAHDVYKPRTPEQAKAVEQHKDEIAKFSKGTSEFLFAKDSGKNPPPPPRPDCPPPVAKTFGCIP
jgi:ppGpp synthetase/RelA/SpoT-type nucleotidyltranferase